MGRPRLRLGESPVAESGGSGPGSEPLKRVHPPRISAAASASTLMVTSLSPCFRGSKLALVYGVKRAEFT